MAAPQAPFDIRSAFFRKYFDQGLPYADYVRTGSDAQQQRWHEFAKPLSLTAVQQELIRGFQRDLNILFLSGVWCGDCMRQGPMLHCIAEGNPRIKLRFIDNQQNPELRDELRVVGGARVPVAVLLSEDFFEVARYGDRTLSHYRRKADRELGPACASGLAAAPAELLEELAEWLEAVERAQLMLRLSPSLRSRHGD